MSPSEVAHRIGDRTREWTWRRRQVTPGRPTRKAPPFTGAFPCRLSAALASAVPAAARNELLDAADRLLDGSWTVLGVDRQDAAAPDWFRDPVSGRRAPQAKYAFRIDHRSDGETGDVKQVWELSRHQHLTVLAAAWRVSQDERYAEAVARQLRSWWAENPFLSGVHWTSGIELGIRLISWTWIRRLLDGWAGTSALFDDNPVAASQIYWHQEYLAAFQSIGSSANNHVIAEASGQLVASCAFPWFRESEDWRSAAAALLEQELEHNTFPSGINRELASEYHTFVAELGLVAAVEAEAAGHPLGDATRRRLCAMVDAAAALVDQHQHGPRQGDGDDGRALLLDAPHDNRFPSLLAAGAHLFGSLPWWPPVVDDVRSVALADVAGPGRDVPDRPEKRPSHFSDAGVTLLRTLPGDHPEIWCRCDAGPHGFLAIAAHAHADALSIEVRHGGVDILADPGTYCYHTEPKWRAYFRSTAGHNTLELGGRNQSQQGGPFLWTHHARSRLLSVAVDTDDDVDSWSAEHDGYGSLDPPAVHSRSVRLDRRNHRLDVIDTVRRTSPAQCRLAFHLGPAVHAELEDSTAALHWSTDVSTGSAFLHLPDGLCWTAHRGETNPILGWYSSGFGRKEPATTLIGTGTCNGAEGALRTTLQFER